MDYILTNAGVALMTEAVTGKALVFTRAETGTGYSAYPAGLTAVIGRQQELSMNVLHENSDVKITCLQNNTELKEGYTLKQIGIYARLAEEEEDTLLIIGQQATGEVIHPYEEGEAEYEFIILMKASGTSSMTVEGGVGSLALKKDLDTHTGNSTIHVTATEKKEWNTSIDDREPTFTQASSRANIESGDTLSILFGKIKKWFADMKSGAFSSVANNCTTTEAGSVLDARQGQVLQAEVDEINGNLTSINNKIIASKTNSGTRSTTDTTVERSTLYGYSGSTEAGISFIHYPADADGTYNSGDNKINLKCTGDNFKLKGSYNGKDVDITIADANIVGKCYSTSGSFTASTTYAAKNSLTLPAGTYVISFTANNSTSAKIDNLKIIIADNSGASANMVAFQILQDTNTRSEHKISCSGIRVLTNETKISGWLSCSDTSLTFATTLKAVRIA